MRFSRLVLLLLISIASPFSTAKNRIVYYEPKIVDLDGVIIGVAPIKPDHLAA
jgi:hypothetical protein